jgi:hypothetical protein
MKLVNNLFMYFGECRMQIIWVILCGSLQVERGVAEPHLSINVSPVLF